MIFAKKDVDQDAAQDLLRQNGKEAPAERGEITTRCSGYGAGVPGLWTRWMEALPCAVTLIAMLSLTLSTTVSGASGRHTLVDPCGDSLTDGGARV